MVLWIRTKMSGGGKNEKISTICLRWDLLCCSFRESSQHLILLLICRIAAGWPISSSVNKYIGNLNRKKNFKIFIYLKFAIDWIFLAIWTFKIMSPKCMLYVYLSICLHNKMMDSLLRAMISSLSLSTISLGVLHSHMNKLLLYWTFDLYYYTTIVDPQKAWWGLICVFAWCKIRFITLHFRATTEVTLQHRCWRYKVVWVWLTLSNDPMSYNILCDMNNVCGSYICDSARQHLIYILAAHIRI